jgi:hypothetical protein
MLCGALCLTLTPSRALSQSNPSSEERSLYTSTAVVTVALLGTSILFYVLDPNEASAVIAISTCSSEISELTTSTHDLNSNLAAHFIDLNRHALAADLAIASGPLLSELLTLLGASSEEHLHILHTHLPSPRRTLMLDALYTLEPLAWIDLLLTHPRSTMSAKGS